MVRLYILFPQMSNEAQENLQQLIDQVAQQGKPITIQG